MSETDDPKPARARLVAYLPAAVVVSLIGFYSSGVWYAKALKDQVDGHDARFTTLEQREQQRDARDSTRDQQQQEFERQIAVDLARVEERVIAIQGALAGGTRR